MSDEREVYLGYQQIEMDNKPAKDTEWYKWLEKENSDDSNFTRNLRRYLAENGFKLGKHIMAKGQFPRHEMVFSYYWYMRLKVVEI